MKIILWILAGFVVTGLAFYAVMSPWYPKNPAAEFLAVIFFCAPSAGAFWMLFTAIRNERSPVRIVLLAFLPYAFLWYYFERVRPGKHRTRAMTAA